jgi:hypothetical protein
MKPARPKFKKSFLLLFFKKEALPFFSSLVSYPERKKPASPRGRRAKFREETPVTRQDEEPNPHPEAHIAWYGDRASIKERALFVCILGYQLQNNKISPGREKASSDSD